MSEIAVRQFYGGAIQGSLAEDFKDVSDLRPVPDHQEVYMNDSEVSIIIELLDLNHEEVDDKILHYYFQDLAGHNESEKTTVLSENIAMSDDFMPLIGPSFPRMAIIGKQSVKKYRSATSPLMDVYIFMVLVRLRNVGTDMLVTLNFPCNEALKNAISLEALDNALEKTDLLLPSAEIDAVFQEVLEAQHAIPAFKELLNTIRVEDWSLFGTN